MLGVVKVTIGPGVELSHWAVMVDGVAYELVRNTVDESIHITKNELNF